MSDDQRNISAQGINQHGIDRDFPMLYEMAQQYDFAERLGGSNAPLLEEADRALRELWEARRCMSNVTPIDPAYRG